jgi:hypothetical protein
MARRNKTRWLSALVLLAAGAAGGWWLARYGLSLPGLGDKAATSGSAGDIHAVDFRNFTYPALCAQGTGLADGVPVRDGEYARTQGEEPFDFRVFAVSFGDLTGDGRDEAAVAASCNTGGTGQFSEGMVFAMRDGRPELIARVEGGDRAYGGIAGLAIERGQLVVERYATDDDGPACCPRYIDTTRLRWDGARLVPEDGTVRRAAPNE